MFALVGDLVLPRDGVKKEKRHVLFIADDALSAYLSRDRQGAASSSSHLHLCCVSPGYGSDRYPVEAGRGSGCGERGV